MSARDREAGSVLLAAVLVLTVLLSLGLSLVALVDTQTSVSGAQRKRDAVFTLAESALTAQVAALAREWPGPGMAATPYPVCTPASASVRCPGPTVLEQAASPDLASGAAWQTSVHDDDGANGAFYSEAATRLRPGYDANRDGRVWVRAQATARGRTRTLVALVGAETQEEPMPRAAVIAGRLELSNQGNKTLVDARGGLVAVRCTPQLLDLTPCLGHTFGSGKTKTLSDLLGVLTTQVSGAVPVSGYTGGPALSPEARARLEATAIADGTWFAACPSAAQLTGRVVYVKSGACSYTGNTTVNSAAAPGLLIVESGSISFGGTLSFRGVVYAANAAGGTGWAVQTSGNAEIVGGVLVDGAATLVAGSSGANVTYDPNAYAAAASYGSAGVVQDTWREIRGS